MPQLSPLRDDELIYIAIRNPNFMNAVSGNIAPNAFYMRDRDFEGEPPYGLSATVLDHCPTVEEIKEITGLRSKVCGVDTLSVGAIWAPGLEVVRTSMTKALIVGMPHLRTITITKQQKSATCWLIGLSKPVSVAHVKRDVYVRNEQR